MKRIIALAALLFAPAAFAGTTGSHTVTVNVSAINEVGITGGNVTLTIDSATAGAEPDAATDNLTADLSWTTNESTKKITVATDLASPNFTLKATAQSVSGGSAAGQVTLSDVAADFVTGISNTTGSCDLAYEASATAADGTGSDTHTVTYTITAG